MNAVEILSGLIEGLWKKRPLQREAFHASTTLTILPRACCVVPLAYFLFSAWGLIKIPPAIEPATLKLLDNFVYHKLSGIQGSDFGSYAVPGVACFLGLPSRAYS